MIPSEPYLILCNTLWNMVDRCVPLYMTFSFIWLVIWSLYQLPYLLGLLPVELSIKIQRISYTSGAPMQKLRWVLALGETMLGWEAWQSLFATVEFSTGEQADRFSRTFSQDTCTSEKFVIISAAASRDVFQFVKHLRITFDAGVYMNQMKQFRLYFSYFMIRSRILSFTFPINEWGDGSDFMVFYTASYPSSLKLVQIVSCGEQVSTIFVSNFHFWHLYDRVTHTTNFYLGHRMIGGTASDVFNRRRNSAFSSGENVRSPMDYPFLLRTSAAGTSQSTLMYSMLPVMTISHFTVTMLHVTAWAGLEIHIRGLPRKWADTIKQSIAFY